LVVSGRDRDFFFAASRAVLRLTQFPGQQVLGIPSLRVSGQGTKLTSLPPSSIQVH